MEVCSKCKGKGKVYDPSLGKYVECPDCRKRRQADVRSGKAIFETFGLDSPDLKEDFIYSDAVKYASTMYTTKSVAKQKQTIVSLLEDLKNHKKPGESYCFGIGKYGRPDVLAYNIASMAYIQGASVAPVMTCRKLYDMSLYEKQEVSTYISKDILIVIIPTNPTRGALRHSMGIMQERAMSDRATIFITTYDRDHCAELLSDKDRYHSKWLATPVFVVEDKKQKNEKDKVYDDNLGLIEED